MVVPVAAAVEDPVVVPVEASAAVAVEDSAVAVEVVVAVVCHDFVVWGWEHLHFFPSSPPRAPRTHPQEERRPIANGE